MEDGKSELADIDTILCWRAPDSRIALSGAERMWYGREIEPHARFGHEVRVDAVPARGDG